MKKPRWCSNCAAPLTLRSELAERVQEAVEQMEHIAAHGWSGDRDILGRQPASSREPGDRLVGHWLSQLEVEINRVLASYEGKMDRRQKQMIPGDGYDRPLLPMLPKVPSRMGRCRNCGTLAARLA